MYIEYKELPDQDRHYRKVILESQDYVIDDGVLYHFYYPKGNGYRTDRFVKQLAVPHKMRDAV